MNPPPARPAESFPRVAVIGAGAVGCYYGGLLARAGHEVVLIGRPGHVAAIREQGLRMDIGGSVQAVRLRAETEAAAVASADLVLFCVKSTDTESAAAAIAPHLAPDALLLTLQNGVDNDIRLQALLPQQVCAAVVYVAAAMGGPGLVRHYGRGELVIADSGRGEALARVLVAAGIPTEVSAQVRSALWAKLVLNCAYNGLSAITRLPYGQLVSQPGVPETIAQLVAECRAVARADGVPLPDGLDAAVAAIATTMAGQHSSTAQDLMRGKPSEIDHLNGYVLRRGRALAVATPANQVVLTLVKALETASGNNIA